MFFSHCALADEGGVSFWIPGFFGSLAATPQQPGWSLATVYLARKVAAIEIAGPVKRRYNNTLRGLDSLPIAVTAA